VDAIFVKGAEGVLVANLIGAQIVSEFGRHPDPRVRINNGTPRTLTVDAALAGQRPDLVVELLRVVQRAGRWAEAHPDETLRFVARRSPPARRRSWLPMGPMCTAIWTSA
jgi:ABC-type nitrate/sulfonate/bicarbonate transport system substrate-binding protein